MANAKDFDIRLTNLKQSMDLFDELATNEQDKIVIAGIRKAGKIILDKAKTNWQRVKKGKSNPDDIKYDFKSKFKISKLSKRSDNFGVKVGIINDNNGYRLRWIEWGTDERTYRAKKSFNLNGYRISKGDTVRTGKIQATHFFYNAVEDTQEKANEAISQAIIDSYNRTIKRLNKKN